MWIQTGVTVPKRLSWVVTSVTLTFDLWPWPFAWTSHLSLVTTSENFMMIRSREHSQKGVTDRQTHGLNQSLSCLVAAKNNRAPLLCYFKLCAAFRSHWWIQTGVTVRKCSIRLKIGDFFVPSYSPETSNLGQIRQFLEPCDLEIWHMTLKTIGHLFYATSSFVQHFIAIGELKLELQSRNGQSRSKSTIFLAVWPWNLTYDLEKQ